MTPILNGLRVVAVAATCAAASVAGAAPGLVDVPSAHAPKAAMDRLEDIARQRGLTVFVRIDHGANAAKVGRTLRPTELLVFGNPMGGTALMGCAQTAGIDLPLKALAWEDASGKYWLSYNDPAYLAQRHDAAACPVVETLRKAVTGAVEQAAAP